LTRGGFSAAAALRGYFYGPKSRLADTLPVRYSLSDCSTPEMLAGEAIIPEPCFASDELPMYYELHVEIQDRGQVDRRTVQLELRPSQTPRLL
jgi:hypothetical protein